MKVGILSTCQYSMFSGGLANTTIALYEMMIALGYEVTILNTNNDVIWYDDCKELGHSLNVRNIKKDETLTELYDFVIELVPFFENEAQRKGVGKHFVIFNRNNILIDTIEYSLFPILNTKINYDGVSAIWCFKELCDDSEKQILEVLTRKPVVLLPYLWTPSIIEAHRAELNLPLWLQVSQKKANWSMHVCETNTTSASSSTIPLLILRQAKLANFPINKYKIHNIEQINKSQFFKDNVLKHCETPDLSGEFIGRQRMIDFVAEPMSCVISHIRFIPFKPMLFDMAWFGIPFIHNSKFLKDITCFNRYYYEDNKISDGVKCLQRMDEDFSNGEGWFKLENIQEFRKYMLDHYTYLNKDVVNIYKNVFNLEVSSPLASPVAITPHVPLTPTPLIHAEKKVILFTDMWENFNASYNFFSLLLQRANPDVQIEFCSVNTLKGTPNAIIFGPFGEQWKAYPSVPKIHFTGENTAPINDQSVLLNLGFGHADMIGDNYLRFPLWILEIDWFNCDIEKIVNPKPIPLERCIKVYKDELERKTKFCSFIVSNPSNELRNKAFQWLNTYKPVDSAGRVYNNVGNKIFAGLGGGGGEHKKLEYLKDYKFSITFENTSSQGYVTEKLLHAKAAGCIPIYWGDTKVERDFDTKSFIDARKIKTKDDLISLVKEIDENPSKYLEMFERPLLDNYHVDWARRTMAECALRIFKILNVNAEVPRFLDITKPITNEISTPLIVTYATRDYLPSLNQLLTSLDAQRRMIQDINVRVYLGNDVPEESKNKLLEVFPFITYAYLPEAPKDFPDMFESKHYAWKIYIYQAIANEKALNGKIIFYMDAGTFLCRWPKEYFNKVFNNDICVLEDEQQFNKQWCHAKCIKQMNITHEELQQHQIDAGRLCFRVCDKVRAFFNEAWIYAQQRDIIVGEKWSGMRDGKPYGHRHDQSILSILALRHKLSTYKLHKLYCDVSLRRTFITHKFLYVHRGNFIIHDKFMHGIDDCFVINLKRRPDRLEKLYTHSPEFKRNIIVHDACDGRNIQMTSAIARLFKPNDFMWKKAIMGCALSHLSLWYKLASDKPEIDNYLILEDDVKFSNDWQAKWKEALPHIPEDYDVIYLGGVLPPNRGGFEMVKEKINPYFSRVKENQIFGQQTPTKYFHFCAYSYVLSKRGAQKILQTIMARDGYYTSADHMICNPVEFLNIYFLDPLVAGCYQDDDPKYATSEFNNFNRVDNFDSDLWNNDERFEKPVFEGNIDIIKALENAFVQQPLQLEEQKQLEKPNNLEEQKQLEEQTHLEEHINPPMNASRFYTLKQYPLEWNLLYEKKWLIELFGKNYLDIENVDYDDVPVVKNPIFIILRNQDYTKLFDIYEKKNIVYSVIHLSDEYTNEPIDFYTHKSCKVVIRNYYKKGLDKKVIVLPLGYHNSYTSPMIHPYEKTPQIPFRRNLWTFFGTNWNNRGKILEPLKHLGTHNLKLYDQWNDETNIKEIEYISYTLDSIFIPCIEGNNEETYRFYEALEAGCIPIVVENEFINYIKNFIHIIPLKSWDQAQFFIRELLNNKETLESYRESLLKSYSNMKQYFKNEVRTKLELI